MDRLESSERRLEQVVSKVERALQESAKAKQRLVDARDRVDAIERQAEVALKNLRDLVRQQEGD